MDREELVALVPGSFLRATARGNTIPHIVVVRRMRIGRRRIVLAAPRAEIRWRTARLGRDNRSVGKAATCRALAPVERVWAIALQALAAAVVWVAVAESAVQELEAERIG